MIKKLVKFFLKVVGLKVQIIPKLPPNYISQEFTMEGALERCTKRGLNVKTVIDVGASDGRWTSLCMKYLPDAKYLLIEAQECHKTALENFIIKHQNVDFILAAAGNREGRIFFDYGDMLGGLASETPFEQNCVEVPVICIDKEVEKLDLKPPYLIKLDTHGFEVPIIEGAKGIMDSTELIIIETYNYQLTNNSLKYYQMCSYMEKLDFSSIEMVDFMLRKNDSSFWQMDTFFIPSNSNEFNYNKYK